MSRTIFCTAGHSKRDPGAIAYDGTTEHSLTTLLQKMAFSNSKSIVNLEGTAFEVVTESEEKTLDQVISFIEKNKTAGSFGIDIHFNFNHQTASGTETIISPKTSTENKRRATWIANISSQILGIELRRRDSSRDYIFPAETPRKSLPIIDRTSIPYIIYEVCFLNKHDLSMFRGKEKAIAEMIKTAALVIDFTKVASETTPFTFEGKTYKLENQKIF